MTTPVALPRPPANVACPRCGSLFRWDFTAAPLRRYCPRCD